MGRFVPTPMRGGNGTSARHPGAGRGRLHGGRGDQSRAGIPAYLRLGDLVTQQVFLEEVSEEKRTALGRRALPQLPLRVHRSGGRADRTHALQDPEVPPGAAGRAAYGGRSGAARPAHPRPAITQDTAFFWEGLKERRLLIRRCTRAQHLHHPPGPLCPSANPAIGVAQADERPRRLHSYVIVHQPQLPGFTYPLPVALVELEEGVRLVANLPGVSRAGAYRDASRG